VAWELKFMQWGNGWWRTSVLDQLIPWLTHLGSLGAVILFILLAWILTRKRNVLYTLLCLYGVQFVVVYGLKFLIRRPRPPAFPEGTPGLFSGPGEILDPSFPSAHTLYAFMIATVLSTRFPRYRVVFFVAAGFIGWTRIYLGLHYPTDVLAGALLGYGVTELFLHWVRFHSARGLNS
jgi:undecaprenyl-diphosphatase